MTISMSQSEIFTFQRCPRMWLLKYYLAYTPDADEVTGSRILGTRVHAALEGYYGYDLDPLAVLHLLYKFELEASPEFEAELVIERDMASAMIEGYVEWLAETGADAGLTVMGTESEVSVPLPGLPDVILRAKLDRVVLDESTGLLSFVDDKTAAGFERHEILMLDPQFRFYSLVQKLVAREVPGAPRVLGGIVNTLRRVKRTDRSKPPYFKRDPFRYNEQMINATLLKVTGVAKKIVAARNSLDWIYSPTGANGDLAMLESYQALNLAPVPILTDCSWRCPFVSLCPMMDDGSDWVGALVRSGHFRQEDPYAYYERDPLHRVRQALAAQ
jgi:PD-(D/E)XK nuclease superfamily